MDAERAAQVLKDQLEPAFRVEKDRADRIDGWARWTHDKPASPMTQSEEHQQLAQRAPTPWGWLVVNAFVQGLFVDGYRGARVAENSPPWRIWQANSMDRRQIGLHRVAVQHGHAYALVLPGTDRLLREPTATIRPLSARQMVALYDDPVMDEWPEAAARFRSAGKGTIEATVYDDEAQHTFLLSGGGDNGTEPKLLRSELHGLGVCPVIRYDATDDTEDRSVGVIEPIITVLGRLDQTKYDRLIVQRFASWVVRTISGMTLPDNTAQEEKLRLAADRILVAQDNDTKFGSLPASPLGGFNEAYDADLRDLAAISQIAPHNLLGQMINLSAEALAAAEASQDRRTGEFKTTLGESHEQTLRLAAEAAGDTESASDYGSAVRWRDTQSRSLAQAADAINKIAQLGVPLEVLIEDIAEALHWPEQKLERAREQIRDASDLSKILGESFGDEGELEPAA